MAPAYQNVSSGQIVVSDEPRPDLEAQARWEEVPVPDETVPPAVTPLTEAELAVAAARDAAASSDANPPASEDLPAERDSTGKPAESDDDEESGDGDADGDASSHATPTEVPVPDETWTDEALDDLAKERGIKFRSNTTKATKVAKLTAPAAE